MNEKYNILEPYKRKLKYPPKNDAKCWRSQVFKYFDVIELFRRKDFKSFVGHRYVITMNVLTFKCQLIHQETRSDVNKFIKKPDIYGQSSSSCRWNLWSVITKLNNTFEPLKHKVTFYKFESLISSKQEWIYNRWKNTRCTCTWWRTILKNQNVWQSMLKSIQK